MIEIDEGFDGQGRNIKNDSRVFSSNCVIVRVIFMTLGENREKIDLGRK